MAGTKTRKNRIEEVGGNGEPKTRGERGTRETIKRSVVLKGVTPIMFDRYAGDNDTQLQPHQKLYFDHDGRTIVLPSANVMSFLSAQNTDSAPKRLLDSRKYKVFCAACSSYVTVSPFLIPFVRDGEPIRFGKFDGDVDQESGIYVFRNVARLKDGIPNPKVRPVLPPPWELRFELQLYTNPTLQEQQLLNVFQQGGIAVGLGTYRGQYGKFEITKWE